MSAVIRRSRLMVFSFCAADITVQDRGIERWCVTSRVQGMAVYAIIDRILAEPWEPLTHELMDHGYIGELVNALLAAKGGPHGE